MLDIGAEREPDAARHSVEATCGAGLDDPVANIVDEIGVDASATVQCVVTRATRQRVGSGIAGQHVVECVAGAVDRGGARKSGFQRWRKAKW